MKHKGKKITRMELPGRKSIAHGVPGEAAPAPEFAPGGELVAVPGTGILVVLVWR